MLAKTPEAAQKNEGHIPDNFCLCRLSGYGPLGLGVVSPNLYIISGSASEEGVRATVSLGKLMERKHAQGRDNW